MATNCYELIIIDSSYDAEDGEAEDSDAEEEVNGNEDDSEEEGNISVKILNFSATT